MDYREMLKRGRNRLPDLNKESSRFEVPAADVMSGRQSVIRNFSEITKALRRDAKHLSKYIFKELAVPGSVRGSELLLQGKFNSYTINQKISDYVKEFVICQECGKPDTSVNKEGRIVVMKCEACGARRPLRTV